MFFVSSHSNNYVYDKGKIILIHPLLSRISQFPIVKDSLLSDDELYYVRKYSFLKDKGHLNKKDEIKVCVSTPLCTEEVIYQLKKIKAISIEITEACNMQCEYCGYSELYEQYGKIREEAYIEENNVYALIAELYQYWKEELNKEIEIIFYGGEPLLGIKKIKNIIMYLEKHYPQIHFVYKMTTNGMLLLKNIPYLIEHDIKLSISIDGNQQHNKYRRLKNGCPSHKQVIKILDTIKSTYPEYYKNNIHLSAVLHNLNTIKEIQEFSQNRLGLYPYIGSLNTNNVKNVKLFKKMYKRKEGYFNVNMYNGNVLKQVRPSEKHLDQFFHDVVHCSYKTIFDLIQQDKIIKFPVQKTCLPFNKELFLTARGEIYPCETIARKYPLGTISNNIVNLSPSYIANLYCQKLKQQLEYCSLCLILPFCFHCLFQVLPATEMNLKCPQYMGEKEFMEYLKVYTDYLELYPSEYSNFCIKHYQKN